MVTVRYVRSRHNRFNFTASETIQKTLSHYIRGLPRQLSVSKEAKKWPMCVVKHGKTLHQNGERKIKYEA